MIYVGVIDKRTGILHRIIHIMNPLIDLLDIIDKRSSFCSYDMHSSVNTDDKNNNDKKRINRICQ